MSDRRTPDGSEDAALRAEDPVLRGTIYTSDGVKIGTAGQVFLDDATGKPEWVTVQTGMFGTKESFVPIATADKTTDGLRVPFDKDTVKGAPRVDAEEGHLSPDEETELYRYYGMSEVGTTTEHETGRARLRKYVVTEQQLSSKGGPHTSHSTSPEESRTAWAEEHADELAAFRAELTARKAELAGVDGI